MREPKTNLPEIEKKYLLTHKPSERTLFVATKVKRVLSVSLDFFYFLCDTLKKQRTREFSEFTYGPYILKQILLRTIFYYYYSNLKVN